MKTVPSRLLSSWLVLFQLLSNKTQHISFSYLMNSNLLKDPNLASDISGRSLLGQWLKQQSISTFYITIIFGGWCQLHKRQRNAPRDNVVASLTHIICLTSHFGILSTWCKKSRFHCMIILTAATSTGDPC
jgi:hypothetical protein